MAGLLSAELAARGGRLADASATLDVYDGTLDRPGEAAYSAYVAALVATLSPNAGEGALDLVEAAVQAQLDALQVRSDSASQAHGASCGPLSPRPRPPARCSVLQAVLFEAPACARWLSYDCAVLQTARAAAQREPLSLTMYATLDPSRTAALVRALLQRAAAAPASLLHAIRPPSSAAAPAAAGSSTGRCLALLDSLARFAPRLPALAELRARAHFVHGDHPAALRHVTELLRATPGDVDARLLQVRGPARLLRG